MCPHFGFYEKTSRMGFAWDSRLPKRPYPWRFAWFSWPQQPIFVSKSKVFCLKSHGERIVPMDPNKIDVLRYLTQIIGQTLPEFRRHGWIGCCKTIFMICFFKNGIAATGNPQETQSHGCFVPRDLLDKRGLPRWLWTPGVPARCVCQGQDGHSSFWSMVKQMDGLIKCSPTEQHANYPLVN